MTVLTQFAGNLAENNFGDTRTGGLAGPMGLFIIVVMSIGTVLLIRNMNSRLRRLPDSFPSGDTGSAADQGTTAGQGATGAPATLEPTTPAGAEPASGPDKRP